MIKSAMMNEKLVPSAKIVDGILVLTLPDALRPVVWQMELGQTKTSAVEVREQNDGTFVLMLKTNRQDVQEIAPYASRELAVRALLTLSRAMEGGQGRLRSANNNLNPNHLPALIPQTEEGRSKAGRMVAGVLILLALVFLFTRMTPSPTTSFPSDSAPAAAAPAKIGQPQSAEDYLNAQ